MSNVPVSIVIPTYNGKSLLEQYLASVLEAVHTYPGKSEVIIVDDRSQDDTVLFLKDKYPEVCVIQNHVNKGFGETVNFGVKKSQCDVILLLNNDVEVNVNFIFPLVRHFESPKVFAVSSKSISTFEEIDGNSKEFNESIIKLTFNQGILGIHQASRFDPSSQFNYVCTISHACGGFSAFDKNKFIQLGCFDDLYSPFYWEDADICYRAWKKGWYVLYEPESVVFHQRNSTVGQVFHEKRILRIVNRNKFFFNWKNLTDEDLLRDHALYLNNYIRDINIPDEDMTKIGFYEAMKSMLSVLKKRKEQNIGFCRTDREVIELSGNVDVGSLQIY